MHNGCSSSAVRTIIGQIVTAMIPHRIINANIIQKKYNIDI